MALTTVKNAGLAGSIDLATKVTGTLPTSSYTAGITEIDQWRLTTSFDLDGTTNPVSSNLERVDGTAQSKLGTGMSVSSGIWTFPSTGFWIVEGGFHAYGRGPVAQTRIIIYTTADNTNYLQTAVARQAMHANDYYGTGYCSTVVDVTDTANVKVKFALASSANTNFNGATTVNQTYFTFKRMADT